MHRACLILGAGCGGVVGFYDTGDAVPQASSALSKLPEVTDVLEPSSDTITRLQSQVIALNSRIKDIAGNEKAKIASAKGDMEARLGSAQEDLETAQSQNDHLRDQNAKLFQEASKLEKHAREVLDANQGLREILDSLKDKVRMGASFISKMEADADWTGARELEVLKTDTTDSIDDLEEEDNTPPANQQVAVVTKGHRRVPPTSSTPAARQNKNISKKEASKQEQAATRPAENSLGLKFLDGKLVKFGQQKAAKKIETTDAAEGVQSSQKISANEDEDDTDEDGEEAQETDGTTNRVETSKNSASSESKKTEHSSSSTGEDNDGDFERKVPQEEEQTTEGSAETSSSSNASGNDSTSADDVSTGTSDDSETSDDSSEDDQLRAHDIAPRNNAAVTSFLALRSEERSLLGGKSAQRATDLSEPGEQNLQWMMHQTDSATSNNSVSNGGNPSVDADSSSMLSVLHSELRQLKQQENASIRTLALAFEKKAKLLRRDKDKVLRLQAKLLRKQGQLKNHKKRLEEAVTFVENTKKQLSQSLAQLGGYLRDLAHIALAPPKESGKILPNLNVELDSHEGLVRKEGSS